MPLVCVIISIELWIKPWLQIYGCHKPKELTWALLLQMRRSHVLQLLIRSHFYCRSSKPNMIPKQQKLQIGSLENKRAAPKDCSSLKNLFLVEYKALKEEIMEIFSNQKYLWRRSIGIIMARSFTNDVKEGSRPIYRQLFCARQRFWEDLWECIYKHLKAGVIEPRQLEWASFIVVITKKNVISWFCAEYQRQNFALSPDTSPLPRRCHNTDIQVETKIFTELEALRGYWQVQIKDEENHKTNFTTFRGTRRYNSRSFCLQNVSDATKRATNIIISKLRWKTCLFLIDVVVIWFKNNQKHVEGIDVKCWYYSTGLNWIVNYPIVAFSKSKLIVLVTYS